MYIIHRPLAIIHERRLIRVAPEFARIQMIALLCRNSDEFRYDDTVGNGRSL